MITATLGEEMLGLNISFYSLVEADEFINSLTYSI